MSIKDLREVNIVVGVSLANEMSRSAELRPDLQHICKELNTMPLQNYMDTTVSFMKDQNP